MGGSLEPADLDHLNEAARNLYVRELEELVADLNRHLPDEQPKLRLPDPKFRRRIGEEARQPYAVDGTLLSAEAYEKHLQEVLPTPEDLNRLDALFTAQDWIEPRPVKP